MVIQEKVSQADLTELLHALNNNRPGSLDRFATFVQSELRKIAAGYLHKEWANDSLQATELVNECFLRVFRGAQPQWSDRAHFFGIAAQSMRQILVDRARRRGALKRPAQAMRLSLEDVDLSSPEKSWQILAVHEALEKLEQVDARLVRVIELRFFTGLSIQETAQVIGVAPATVKRDWMFAMAWLHRELS